MEGAARNHHRERTSEPHRKMVPRGVRHSFLRSDRTITEKSRLAHASRVPITARGGASIAGQRGSGETMYKITHTMDFSEYFGDNKRWISHMTLHYVEIPFVRQWAGEWQYLRNWSARRDKHYITNEGYDMQCRNLMIKFDNQPIWDFRQLDEIEQRILTGLQAEGRVDYDTEAKEYAVTNSGRAWLEGRELPNIVIPPYNE
jgi:hypothetical protein